jgi:hypothetical protein
MERRRSFALGDNLVALGFGAITRLGTATRDTRLLGR